MANQQIELGENLSPQYDAAGLISVIAQCATTKAVLMLAYMNAAALKLSCETKIAHYWSRSRQSIWKKGATSGQLQIIKELRIDCDQDCILLLVEVQGDGGCCHVGFDNCFYRALDETKLVIDGKKPLKA